MDAELDLRPPKHGPRPGPDRSDPELVRRIANEIAASGPITFARFMERALYEPELGYYRREENPAARTGGDFLTAPETHPIFGAALARALAKAWALLGRPANLVVQEYGAGAGTLARAVLEGVRRDAPDFAATVRYEAVEINDIRRAAIEPPVIAISPEAASRQRTRPVGVVVANEFLDAFPVHRVEGSAEGLREVFVDRSAERFVDRLGPPSTTALEARLEAEGIALESGQRAEIALGIEAWLEEASRAFEGSVVIVIDYGHEAQELYAPRRRGGTLLGYLGQTVVDDPYANIGRQDLTARVDLTALETAARARGFDMLERTTQSAFLVANGIEDLLERERSRPELSLGEYVELRSAIVRLLDPRALGAFSVSAFGKGVPAAGRGVFR